jgi:HEAT repeat protein
MNRLLCLGVVGLMVILAGAGRGRIVAQGKNEPDLAGKPLRVWLRALFEPPDSEVRAKALEVLDGFCSMSGEAAPALARALQDKEESVRGGAARSLPLCGRRAVKAVPALLRTLGRDASPYVRA